ncbi:hypothetical protein GCM10027285_07550 [Oleiagrimonas citrea]
MSQHTRQHENAPTGFAPVRALLSSLRDVALVRIELALILVVVIITSGGAG